MSLGFFSAFLQAGGKEAARGLRDTAMRAAPNTSIAAGQIVQEGKLDDAGEVVQRTRHHLNDVQAHLDAITPQYNQQTAAAEAIDRKITGFQVIIDDPNASAEAKAQAQRDHAAHSASLEKMLTKLEPLVKDVEHTKKELAETQGFLTQAETAFRNKATKTVNSVQEANEVRRELDAANLKKEQALQQEKDAKVISGIATEGDEENPAIAAMKRAVAQANDDAEQHQFKAQTLTSVVSMNGDDDPIVKAALAETSGATAGGGSLSDRLAALRQRAA